MTPARTAPLGTPPPEAPAIAAGTPSNPRRVSVSQVVGEVLLTVGALLLLFAFYESYWTNIAAGRMQDEAQQKLEVQWDNQWVNPRERPAPALGDAFARMYIPVFGPDYQFAIIEGVDEQALLTGPGRYPDTQMPGEPGNFAVAGHRVGKGAPFNDLGALKTCDAIVVETQSSWVTYRVLPMSGDQQERVSSAAACMPERTVAQVAAGRYAGVLGRHITTPGDIDVINPLPGDPSLDVADGMLPLITLTTCHPQFSNAERMIIHAVATEVMPKSPDGAGQLPAAMT
ncbi:class E sortase [Corynebacterium sp. TA-R-1]|uniref:Class E sortase n=1 Tax=Corynebacterium stercoris TaxID=2943490 RepID=A0ABT1G0D5_9CORY|nr:class E sortase [Corynebacterium stercoris]MCP1387490.1 class E sortase [Corynebacterium stercoris]